MRPDYTGQSFKIKSRLQILRGSLPHFCWLELLAETRRASPRKEGPIKLLQLVSNHGGLLEPTLGELTAPIGDHQVSLESTPS